ncbi:hypothetical protein D3C85_1183370 [compost metagenome]
MIDKQQLDRCFAEHFTFALEAIVRGAAEYVTFQRDQLQRGRAFVPDQRSLQLLVGVGKGSVQYAFDFGAGVPGTADADGPDGDHNSQKHAC